MFFGDHLGLYSLCVHIHVDDDDDGAGAGQRGGLIRLESLAVLYGSFSSSSCL